MQTELSPLMQALYTGRADEAQRLVAELGSDTLNVHEAAAVGDVARLRQLIGADSTLVNAWSTDGFQPLALAAFFGRRAAVELLLELGAEVNTQAAGAEVNARQQGGADVEARDDDGRSAADFARTAGHAHVLGMLVSQRG